MNISDDTKRRLEKLVPGLVGGLLWEEVFVKIADCVEGKNAEIETLSSNLQKALEALRNKNIIIDRLVKPEED